MIATFLVLSSVLAQGDDVVTLQSGQPYSFELSPDDPVLEGAGPARSFRYVVEGDHAMMFLSAESEDLDLVLRLERPKTSGGGAAALLAGGAKGASSILQDDDSGGGTIPYLHFEHKGGGELRFQVAAKDAGAASSVTIRLFESREIEATVSLAKETEAAIGRSQQLRASGDLEGARAVNAEMLERIRAFEGFEDSAAIGGALWKMGFETYALQDLAMTEACWRAALSFQERTLPSLHVDLQWARGNLGRTLVALGRTHEALELEEQVVAARTRLSPEDHPDLLTARTNLATTLVELGEVDRALAILKDVLAIRSRTLPPEHVQVLVTKSHLSVALGRLGRLEETKALEEEILSAFAKILPDDHPDLQRIRLNLSGTLFELGHLAAARALTEKALAGLRQSLPPDHLDLLTVEANLADLLAASGDHSGARVLREHILKGFSEQLAEDHPRLQRARTSLAASLTILGEDRAARSLYEHALEIHSARTFPGDLDWAITMGNIAQLDLREGDLEAAQERLRKLSANLEGQLADDHRFVLWLQSLRCSVLEKSGRLAEALEERRAFWSLVSRKYAPTHPLYQVWLSELALLQARAGGRDEANASIRQLASALIESTRQLAAYSTRELEARIALDQARLSVVLSLASGAGAWEPDPLSEAGAFALCELQRAAPGCSARWARASRGSLEAGSIRAELHALSREVSTTLKSPETDSTDLFEALSRKDRLERQLLAMAEGAGGELQTSPTDVARALAPDEAAIGFWRYERTQVDLETGESQASVPSYVAWVVRPDRKLRRIELGAAGPLEAAVDQWRRAMQGEGGRGVTGRKSSVSKREPAASLEALLADPLAEHLQGAKRLWVAPAQALHLVPLDALPKGDGLWGDEHEIVIVDSLSEIRSEPAGVPAPRGLLAYGGIDYRANEKAESAPFAGSGVPEQWLRAAGAASPFVSLPATLGEAEAVAEQFRQAFGEEAGSVSVLTGSQATKRSFDERASQYRFLHLATHGWFAPESVPSLQDARSLDRELNVQPGSLQANVSGLAPFVLCGLAFAGAARQGGALGRVDGILTAEELLSLDLSGCELATLSACETNLGVRRKGQGIASLRTALHAAGARTAITSLWKVPDDATRQLMTELYRRLWVLGESKGEALWQAKLMLRRQKDADGRPKYRESDWAAWVLSGDPGE
ncbi:MAG: CHAT domain-containing tetratricopeptide repeat protein [Planctomycetota bacterium]